MKSFDHPKIKTAAEIAAIVGPYRDGEYRRLRTVVMCHGTFDLVHPGHIRHLTYAKSKADILIASLTADQHVTKADYRPFIPQDLRAYNLAALEAVDYVLIDPHPTPLRNIAALQPDIFAKGFEYAGGRNPGTTEEIAAVEAYGGEVLFTPGDVVHSSSRIIDRGPPSCAADKLAVLLEAEGLGFADLRNALDLCRTVRVHVVGDAIVDSYTNCTAIGASTKTPTLSVRLDERRDFVGGAAVVARHLAAAGATVTLSTVLGDDRDAMRVIHGTEGVGAKGVNVLPLTEPGRPTTVKNVILAGGQTLLKIDTVDNRPIAAQTVEQLADAINTVATDVVIFSDFRHGIFNRETIPRLTAAIPRKVFRAADSQVASRWGNILDFEGFDLITPNEREARFALGDQDSVVRALGSDLYRRAGCATLMLKLGARGLMTFRDDPRPDNARPFFFAVDSFADHVVDAVGSGDALLAYATLAMATGNPVIASVLGSFAAAVACGRQGNVPVERADVLNMIDGTERRTKG